MGEGEERSAIERLISELHLNDTVRLLGTRRDIGRLLQAADMFLLTSVSEGIPLTLIEAMATGLPCVATRVGGVPEVVIDGETGLLTNVGDAASLAKCLNRLAAEPTLREQFGQAGYRQAAKLFNADDMHAAYQTLYRQLSGPMCGGQCFRRLSLTNRPNLIVFSDDWGRHPSSCQHLTSHLLDDFNVTWLNTIGTRPPRLDLATVSRCWTRSATGQSVRQAHWLISRHPAGYQPNDVAQLSHEMATTPQSCIVT